MVFLVPCPSVLLLLFPPLSEARGGSGSGAEKLNPMTVCQAGLQGNFTIYQLTLSSKVPATLTLSEVTVSLVYPLVHL